ncbi:hypothetical protein AAG570_001237 [Ranatra chinensis]|uniref:Methyltransferase-like protein 4 n=1 Tax=Ranatra chinensis TaxID=642074 RepID=A0ABD0YXQ6_9HEMI
MSVIYEHRDGWVLSHYNYIKNIYTDVRTASGIVDFTYPMELFNIGSPFVRDAQAKKIHESLVSEVSANNYAARTAKRKHVDTNHSDGLEERCASALVEGAKKLSIFCGVCTASETLLNNRMARAEAAKYHRTLSNSGPYCYGGNNDKQPVEAEFGHQFYVYPERCSFYQFPMERIIEKLDGKQFDLILLDPPWRNKFVKRKKLKNFQYNMMYNEELQNLPLGSLLKKSGMVIVWTTNSPNHIADVKEKLFPAWGVQYTATWFWIKVTKYGELICPLFEPNGKKPYERILIGSKADRNLKCPEEYKCIVSIPSAIHSHKPPLVEVLQPYIPDNADCLELFARYLLPGWTSFGDQVLSLQQSLLFNKGCK